MNINQTREIILVFLVLALLAVGYAAVGPQTYAKSGLVTPLSTPAGITLQPLDKFAGYGLDKETAALNGHDRIAYADASGMTLYTYKEDSLGGKSACVDECAETWRPALVMEGAGPVGDWSVITREDGTRQWALADKPLYTYVKDVDIGSVGGNSPKRYGRGPKIGERGAQLAPIAEDVPLPEKWDAALQHPASTDGVPPDLSIREIQDAEGLVLVSSSDRTLYVFDGDPNKDREACGIPCPWTVVAAPQLAAAVGDFAPFARDDGIQQWTYKDLGLYAFAGDLSRDDANGDGIFRDWQVAHVMRNFRPENVSLQHAHRLGKILATAKGQTLYRRDSYLFQSGSGHGQRRGVLIRPAVGRDIGTEPRCREECDMWRPFLAADDAVPQGFWDVYTRADGSKQWAYQGYALWTYDGDQKPGDINADDNWQIKWDITSDSVVDIGTPYDGVAALYWAATFP